MAFYLLFKNPGCINLINFKLKAQALRLAGMVSIINSPCDSSFFLGKYFAGRPTSSLRPMWAHLRDNSSPSAALPSLFYRSCLDTLSAVGNCDVTAKALYCKLLSSGSPHQFFIGNGLKSLGQVSL